MTRYVLKRLVLLPALLFLFSVTVFAFVQAPPGDFLTTYVATLASSGSAISAEQVDALRREYGLDRPIWVQYLKWMENLAKGHLGLSLEYQRPNAELIGERLVLTMVLALLSFVFTWIVAIPAGIYSAMHPRSAVDYLLTVVNYVGVATPNFMLALVPLVSTIGWYLPALFSGSLIVATVMNLPNIGPLLLRALINQDMYLAGSILLIYCFLTIVGTLVSDILLAWLDPRIRLGER